jgi:hypothetical protein
MPFSLPWKSKKRREKTTELKTQIMDNAIAALIQQNNAINATMQRQLERQLETLIPGSALTPTIPPITAQEHFELILVPPQPGVTRVFRSFYARRDGSGPETAEVRIKKGNIYLAGQILGKNDSITFNGPITINPSESLAVESSANLCVDSVALDDVVLGTAVPSGFISSNSSPSSPRIPVPEPLRPELPDSEKAETMAEGRMKAYLKEFKKEKKE